MLPPQPPPLLKSRLLKKLATIAPIIGNYRVCCMRWQSPWKHASLHSCGPPDRQPSRAHSSLVVY